MQQLVPLLLLLLLLVRADPQELLSDCSTMALKVGIIGAGANTKSRHIPGLQAIEGVEILSVANRSPESTRAVADEFGIPKRPDSWQELIADPELERKLGPRFAHRAAGQWPVVRTTQARWTWVVHY